MNDQIRMYHGGMVDCNGYLVETEEGFIAIDAPAGMTDWLLERRPDAKVTHLLITHMHFDHVEDAARMKKQFGCKILAHSPFNDDLTLSRMASTTWHMRIAVDEFVVDEAFSSEMHSANWGGLHWLIHHVPGHSPDSVAYHLPDEQIMFVGDIIFAGSVGRTDFPGGSLSTLRKGIHDRIFNQDANTRLYPGHGPYTSIGEESLSNPYLA